MQIACPSCGVGLTCADTLPCPCPCCDGTGGEMISVEPIEMADLEAIGGAR